MMELSSSQIQEMRASAHNLHPVVTIAQKGLTPAIITETGRALDAHGLIKVKLAITERSQRQILARQLATELSATLVQIIGSVAVLWRATAEKETPEKAKKGIVPSKKLAASTIRTQKRISQSILNAKNKPKKRIKK